MAYVSYRKNPRFIESFLIFVNRAKTGESRVNTYERSVPFKK